MCLDFLLLSLTFNSLGCILVLAFLDSSHFKSFERLKFRCPFPSSDAGSLSHYFFRKALCPVLSSHSGTPIMHALVALMIPHKDSLGFLHFSPFLFIFVPLTQ